MEIIYILYTNNGVWLLMKSALFPDIFLLIQCKVKLGLNIEVFSMAF